LYLGQATTDHSEIPDSTARCIAHVLGRAYGREIALADYGRTGEGNYLSLRDEYLALYNDPSVTPVVNELIDWLGTYLVLQENTGTGRQFTNPDLPPKLEQLLVRTRVRVGDERFIVNVPASWDSGYEDDLVELLHDLRLPEDPALQAFLSLPDVSAGADNIMESFHEAFAGMYASEEQALRALSPFGEWETELADWSVDQGIESDALQWNLEPLLERLRTLYDLVENIEAAEQHYKHVEVSADFVSAVRQQLEAVVEDEARAEHLRREQLRANLASLKAKEGNLLDLAADGSRLKKHPGATARDRPHVRRSRRSARDRQR
jgi:hypothetical protein